MASVSNAFANDDDDLIDQSKARTPSSKRPASTPNPASKAVPVNLPADEDLGDAVGTEALNKPKTPKMLRPEKAGETKRLALLDKATAPWKRAYIHAEKGKGVIRCLAPKAEPGAKPVCCRHWGEPSEGYYTLAVSYTNADPARGLMPKDTSPVVTVTPIKLSPYAYSQIMALQNPEDEKDSIFAFDIGMAWAGSDILKGYSFTRMASPPKYKQLGEPALTALLAEWKDGSKLSRAVAKTVSEAEVRAMIGGVEKRGGELDPEDED
jgi:hypothetical protein